MALPTMWELLLPNFSIMTLIGILLILIGIFKGGILLFIGKILSMLTGGEIKEGALVGTFIGGGVIMIWLPSIITDLFSSTEGILVFVGVILFLILVLVLIGKKGKGQSITGF